MKDYSNYYPTFKETVLESGRHIFNLQLEGFEGEEIIIGDNTIPTKALVRYHQNPLNEFKQDRKITFWNDVVVSRGNYIKTTKDDRVFIILSAINNNDMVQYALMRECNHTLKWINSKNELITRECIEDARTLYTTGVKNEKVIEIPDSMIGIQLPYDEGTKLLNRKDTFVLNKYKYKITFYDEITHKGLISLICEETAVDTSKDDLVNEIADRWIDTSEGLVDRLPWLDDQELPIEPEIPPEPIVGVTYTVEAIDGYGATDGSEIYSTQWYKYTIHKFVDDAEVVGTFTFNVDDMSLATITETGNDYCVVTARQTTMGGIIVLTITDTETNEVAIKKNIKITGW